MNEQVTGAIEGIVLCAAETAECERVYLLLPTLGELLGKPGFGTRDPICLPGTARPLDGWALFGSIRERGVPLH